MKMSNMTSRWGKKAGIEWKSDGLRHSYASYRLAMTCDLQALSLEMGNSPRILHDHYLDLKHEDEAVEWFSSGRDGTRWNFSHRLLPVQQSEKWLRGWDLNPRPSGYEPDELPGCSTPRLRVVRLAG